MRVLLMLVGAAALAGCVGGDSRDPDAVCAEYEQATNECGEQHSCAIRPDACVSEQLDKFECLTAAYRDRCGEFTDPSTACAVESEALDDCMCRNTDRVCS